MVLPVKEGRGEGVEREISEVKIYIKSLRKCTWRRRKALLLMEGKGDMREKAIVSDALPH